MNRFAVSSVPTIRGADATAKALCWRERDVMAFKNPMRAPSSFAELTRPSARDLLPYLLLSGTIITIDKLWQG